MRATEGKAKSETKNMTDIIERFYGHYNRSVFCQ
jgi:hypothetical protein